MNAPAGGRRGRRCAPRSWTSSTPRVQAPFNGRVVNLNISIGALLPATGVEVCHARRRRQLVRHGQLSRDTSFRQHSGPAPTRTSISNLHPGRHFRGTVVSAWAWGRCRRRMGRASTGCRAVRAVPRTGSGSPLVFRCASRLEDPDESFRVGASAVATVSRHTQARGSVSLVARVGGLSCRPRARTHARTRRRDLSPDPGLPGHHGPES